MQKHISGHAGAVPSTPDLVIYGGGIAGCMAAAVAAESGKKVVVIDKRAYPGREVAAYNHSFINDTAAGADQHFRLVPSEFQPLFCMRDNREIVASEGYVRQTLLRILEQRGIVFLSELEAVGASSAGDRLTGLLLAGPIGLAWLPTAAVIDATEQHNLKRLLAGQPYVEAGEHVIHASFELKFESESAAGAVLNMKSEVESAIAGLHIAADSIKMHPTIRRDTLAVEYSFTATAVENPFCRKSAFDADAVRKSTELACRLKERVQGFSEVSLHHLGFECHIAPVAACGKNAFHNLITLPALPWGFSLEDIVDVARAGENAVGKLNEFLPVPQENCGHITGGLNIALSELELTRYDDDALNIPLYQIAVNDRIAITDTLSADVCVAGLGTAGGMAMAAASEQGSKVVALEVNSEPGGTFASGRVVGFYAGYKGGAVDRYLQEAEQLPGTKLNTHGRGGIKYSEYIRHYAEKNGVTILTGSRVCGVRRSGNRVAEIIAANENGLFSVKPKVTVDATGDADVAAFAGAEYRIGDERDGMMQSFSMWASEITDKHWLNNIFSADPDIIRPTLYSERLRAVSTGHRNNSYHHISPFFTVREARRIIGEKALTLAGILDQDIPDDVIAVATTSADSHAHISNDLSKFSIVGKGMPIKVRIPYGCFIPAGLDGLLVTAKAISGERDATCFCRMNADMQNHGFIIGTIAAKVAQTAGGKVREVDLRQLQQLFKTTGLLPEWSFTAQVESWANYHADELATIASPELERLLYCRDREAVVKSLEQRYLALEAMPEDLDIYNSAKAIISLALSWYGSPVGNRKIEHMFEQAVQTGLHRTFPHVGAYRTRVPMSDARASDFSIVNRLLVFADRIDDKAKAVRLLSELIADTAGLGCPFQRTMLYDRERHDVPVHPFYHRLRNIAFAAGRFADATLAPVMDRLLALPDVTGHDVKTNVPKNPEYMLAYLEVQLAAAALRCSSEKGAEILKRYLDDTHVFFREFARHELEVAGVLSR